MKLNTWQIQLPHTLEESGWPVSEGKRSNQLWNRVAVPRRLCETKGKLKHCLRVASFSPHSSISRLATMSLYESYSQSRIRNTSLQCYVLLWTTPASCVPIPTGANRSCITGRNTIKLPLYSVHYTVLCKEIQCNTSGKNALNVLFLLTWYLPHLMVSGAVTLHYIYWKVFLMHSGAEYERRHWM